MKSISIIVPVCNVAEKIRVCLDSLLAQTMEDIEIICVDDFSKDGCSDILREYAQKDSRILNIFHSMNMSTSQARKDGVMASCGKYVMFVDGDDFLEPNACETAFNAIEQNQTDIVQFGVNIVNCTGVSESRNMSNQKAVRPCLEYIEADNLIRACWRDKAFGFTLWSKIYNGDVCRKAFSVLEDGCFPKAQDMYAFFLIAYYAKTSSGIEDVLYNYNFGIGVVGGSYLDWQKFETLLTQRNVYAAIERFLVKRGKKNEYRDILMLIYKHFLNECVNKWNYALRTEFASLGFEKLVETWGFEDVLSLLAERNWYSRDKIAEKMLSVDYFKHIKRPVGRPLTIAMYYRQINDGGAQRVVALLCNIFASMKDENGNLLYRVILLTDTMKQENEYPLDANVLRDYLPDNETSIGVNYRKRFEAWQAILDQYQIDVVVDGMWVAPCTLWDMLCIKGHKSKPAFVLHCHSFCCLPYRFEGNTGLELTYSYQLCDGVVTLSECDRRFVSAFSHNVRDIVNPITFRTNEIPCSSYEPDTLIWVGRLSWEKQPLEAVYAMDYVVKEVPEAKLYMIGDGSETMTDNLKNLIHALGLEDHVILTGFTQEVEKYYAKAMVSVGTSSLEGFSLTFCEAMSYSVPIVSYEMPWLTFMKDGRGIVSVKQKRPDLLAREIVRLLKNPQMCRTIGSQGREQVLKMEQVDIGREWKTVFDHMGDPVDVNTKVSDEAILYRYISEYQQTGKTSIRASLEKRLHTAWEEKSEINRKLQITYDEKYERGLEIKRLNKELKTMEDRLHTAWNEKSEINKKLQITYKEKYDRGIEIKELKKEIEMIRNSKTFRLGRIMLYIPSHIIARFRKRKEAGGAG